MNRSSRLLVGRQWSSGLAAASVLALLVLLLAACGGSDSTEPANGGGKTPAATSGGASSAAVEAGKKVAQSNCVTCHTTDGRVLVGPSWKGLHGSKVELESGETVTADDAYLKESILNPNAKIVKGYPAAMPSFQGVLSDEQINNLIAYIKSVS